jgi:purine nucleosidase
MTAAPLNVIIDCDPGIDDAVMLMMAMLTPRINLAAITTVAGNVPLALTSRNARIIRQRMNCEHVPVYAGCPRPMTLKTVTAEDFHGESGIAGVDVFEPAAPLAPGHAVNALIERLRAPPPGGWHLILSGPMTNFASALVMAPDIVNGLASLTVMAGADTAGGNITPYAEYNVYADPEAAAIVFSAGMPITVLSLDVTHTVRADAARVARIREIAGPHAAMMADLLDAANVLEMRWHPGRATPMHDPSTVAWLLAPELFRVDACQVSVITRPGQQFGRTRVRRNKTGPHRWVTAADADRFFELIEDLLKAQA